jgi:hypothetical protein
LGIFKSGFGFFERSQALHQAAFAAGSIILVKNTLLGGLIQRADSSQGGAASIIHAAGFDGQASFLDESASAAAENTVANAAFLVLFVAFDL